MQTLEAVRNRGRLMELFCTVQAALRGQSKASATQCFPPWATQTIGRSSDITSFSMWMKCTLRAEALRRGGKGVGTHCVSSTHKHSTRVKGVKEIHCGGAVWLPTEIKLRPLTFHVTSGLCVDSATVSELLQSKQNAFCLHSKASFFVLSHF